MKKPLCHFDIYSHISYSSLVTLSANTANIMKDFLWLKIIKEQLLFILLATVFSLVRLCYTSLTSMMTLPLGAVGDFSRLPAWGYWTLCSISHSLLMRADSADKYLNLWQQLIFTRLYFDKYLPSVLLSMQTFILFISMHRLNFGYKQTTKRNQKALDPWWPWISVYLTGRYLFIA